MSDIYINVKQGGGQPELPVTGQTTSYRTGDDGDIQAGISNTGRFVDNGNGTITDNATGLMWRKWSMGMNQSNGSGSASTYTWDQAVDLIGDSHAGFSDWRLPNILELASILRSEATGGAPYTYTTPFPSTVSGYYWTSTTYPSITTNVMAVGFVNGDISRSNKANTYYVRLVRKI